MKTLFITYNSYINHLGGAELSSFLYYRKLSKKNKIIYASAYPFNGALLIPRLYKIPFVFTILTLFYLIYYVMKYKVTKIIVGDRITLLPSLIISFIFRIDIDVFIRDFWFCCNKSTRYHDGIVCNGTLLDELKLNPLYRWPIEIYKFIVFRVMFLLLKSKNVRVIAISRYIQKVLKQHGLKSKLMYNLIDLEEIKNAKKITTNGKIIVMYLGRLSSEKGVDLLIDAFKEIKKSNVELWIVGSGNLKDVLVKKSMGDKRIKFIGRKNYPEVYNFFKTADIIVYPVKWDEPFGRVIAEAKAFNKIIIASKRGGIVEQLDNYSKAKLIEPDLDQLVLALKDSLNIVEVK